MDASSMLKMYGRCGVVEDANTMFLTMSYIDSVSWNAMIAALAQHGCGVQAIGLFERMLKEDMLPDRVTFLIILSACSHAGLVKEGRHYSSSMRDSYGISPDEEHYARMIDMLCRCGEFTEAKDLIKPQTRTSDAVSPRRALYLAPLVVVGSHACQPVSDTMKEVEIPPQNQLVI
ncbi:hypothetical protein DVH24_023482 [Malus domestica]|uniref:Pentatricopeptide repeat-containing protein n=1 Tax=Malus domestica TaxID=3750 RepID=A0A498I030_MALDO|nr:hypothetical protein DVH24_023482 [Malus domestica]